VDLITLGLSTLCLSRLLLLASRFEELYFYGFVSLTLNKHIMGKERHFMGDALFLLSNSCEIASLF
jgi:hypothetical protein